MIFILQTRMQHLINNNSKDIKCTAIYEPASEYWTFMVKRLSQYIIITE